MKRGLFATGCLLGVVCARSIAADAPAAPRIAENCPRLVSFASVECRASELVRAMKSASEVGTLDRTSPTIAERARVAIADAELACERGRRLRNRASAQLGSAVQLLDRLRRRLLAQNRRTELDAAQRDLYLAVILPLRDDVRALRKQLLCPSDSENVCGDGIPQTGFAGGPGQEECDDGNTKDGDGCSAQCRLEPTANDFSAFERFTFRRESGLGFCPPTGELFAATVARDVGGVTTLHWSMLRDDAACGQPPFLCAHVDRFARALTFAEVAQLRDAFRAVQVVDKTPNGCGTIFFDPCLVNAFRWDDFSASDFLCQTPLVPAEEVDRIIAVLTGLAHCSGDCREGVAAAEYQCLEEGNPGVPDDQIVVERSGAYNLTRPFSLQSVTNGLTVTAYLPDTEATDHVIFQANFTSLGRPGDVCSVGISAGAFFASVDVRPDGGVALDITQAGLEFAVQVLQESPFQDCSDVRGVRDLSLASFYLVRELSPPPDFRTETIRQVDAVAVGVGEGVSPTAETPPPDCQRVD